MYPHIFKQHAEKDLDEIDADERERILRKLYFYLSQDNPLKFAQRLISPAIGQWRFRIGDFRVLFDHENGKIVILRIGHRRDIYR